MDFVDKHWVNSEGLAGVRMRLCAAPLAARYPWISHQNLFYVDTFTSPSLLPLRSFAIKYETFSKYEQEGQEELSSHLGKEQRYLSLHPLHPLFYKVELILQTHFTPLV